MKETIKVGDVVQIQSDQKRANWKLAIVEKITRGADGLVRSAEIRTANGRTNRPINKLYPIEVTERSNAELSKHPEIVTEETRRASGRIQRKAAHQASEKIKNIAYLESIIEE